MTIQPPFDYVTCIVCHQPETIQAALPIESACVANVWICPWWIDELFARRMFELESEAPMGCIICHRSAGKGDVRHFVLLRGTEAWFCPQCLHAIHEDIDYDSAGFPENGDDVFTFRQKLSLRPLNEWAAGPGECESCHKCANTWAASARQLVRCKECGDRCPWLCAICDGSREHHHLSM